jgi:membrane protein DedA with SNARE-associated domain
MGLSAHWWQYTLLFVAVTASWAGVPMIGATAAAAAGAAAAQGTLSLFTVVVVTTAGGEVGGLLGYAIGSHWGRTLLGRPGKHLEARQRILEKGERAYARWGRLAVFFTPAIVSGTAKMQRGQFALWNLLAALAFAFSVCASAYGLGRVLTGHVSPHDVGVLVAGLAAGGGLVWVARRRRRRAREQRAT